MKTRAGLTLLELLVVMTIIGMLASLMIFGIAEARKKASLARAQAETAQLSQAWKAYWTVYGKWPASCNGVREKVMDAATMQILMGIDLGENPKKLKFMEPNSTIMKSGYRDPWGQLYVVNFNKTTKALSTEAYMTTVFFPNRKRYDYDP